MNALRRAARIVADEGVESLFRRLGRKVLRQRPAPVLPVTPDVSACEPADNRIALAQVEYERQVHEFEKRAAALGHRGLEHYYWYHTVDLGNGLVTPGDYDYRDQLAAFDFPADMTGMRVLDVGSATGYFAFEFERRGAEVVSVELPSLAAWDVVARERDDILRELTVGMGADTVEQAYDWHLTGPFRFCQTVLGSRVRRVYSSVYDLTLDKVGGERFDLVYAGDVLLHLFSPLRALDVLTGLCRRSIVATIDVPFPGPAELPFMRFMGNVSMETDRRTWWMLSSGCLAEVFKRLGFRNVSVVGEYSGFARRPWFPYVREVVRATK